MKIREYGYYTRIAYIYNAKVRVAWFPKQPSNESVQAFLLGVCTADTIRIERSLYRHGVVEQHMPSKYFLMRGGQYV